MSDLPSALASALADRYALEREIGSGGMATVYLAKDLRHHRKVALKVLKPELAAVLAEASFTIMGRERLFDASRYRPHEASIFANYDVHPDGDRFLIAAETSGDGGYQLTVAVNLKVEAARTPA